MGIFSKLFGRNKNTVQLTPEEAFAPEKQPEPAPEVKPEPEKATEKAPEAVKAPEIVAEPEKVKVTFTKNLRIYAASANPDDTAALLRPLFVEKGISVSEDSEGFVIMIAKGLNVSIVRAEENLIQRLADRYSAYAAALSQINLFNLCLGITISADNREKAQEARSFITSVAEALKGFIEWDETALHTCDGKLLINAAGETDFETYEPKAAEPEPVDPDLERMERSFETMKAHGISYDSGKPVQIRAENAALRPVDETASRAASLFGCVLVASAYLSPKEIAAPASFSEKALSRLQTQYNIVNSLTAKEKLYLKKPQFHSAYMMKSEACAVLLWALGYIDLPWPDAPVDTALLGAVLKGSDMARLVSCARPRRLEEVLDMQDLTFRLHSYCVLRENTAGINEDAVYERHYALNWLLSVNGITAWDDIIPKT